MVLAWKMDPSCGQDQREEHKFTPNQPVSEDDLKKIGVECFKMPFETAKNGTYIENPELKKMKKDRGYTYEDDITISREKLPNYDEKLKMFFEEHLHSDEEIRYCLEGSGYFDVRDDNDEWIRIALVPGDLIVLPCGIYHRFTLDTNNYIRAKRFFVGEPVWTPHNRPCDEHPARKTYEQTFGKTAIKA